MEFSRVRPKTKDFVTFSSRCRGKVEVSLGASNLIFLHEILTEYSSMCVHSGKPNKKLIENFIFETGALEFGFGSLTPYGSKNRQKGFKFSKFDFQVVI